MLAPVVFDSWPLLNGGGLYGCDHLVALPLARDAAVRDTCQDPPIDNIAQQVADPISLRRRRHVLEYEPNCRGICGPQCDHLVTGGRVPAARCDQILPHREANVFAILARSKTAGSQRGVDACCDAAGLLKQPSEQKAVSGSAFAGAAFIGSWLGPFSRHGVAAGRPLHAFHRDRGVVTN
jgi:hypothetical protein